MNEFATPSITKGLKPVEPAKRVIPNHSERRLRCKCGSMQFTVMVIPKLPERTTCRSSAITCVRCLKVCKVLLDGTLEREGQEDHISRVHAHLASYGSKLDADDA